LQLTAPQTWQNATAFWPAELPSNNLAVSFDSSADSGTGADGLSLIFADPTRGAVPASLGGAGFGLAFGGIPGLAVALDEYRGLYNPSGSFVGVSDGIAANGASLHWIETANLTGWLLQGSTTHTVVQLNAGTLTVWVNGVQYLSIAVSVPPNVLVGFGASTGGSDNRHAISNPLIVSGGIPNPPATPIGQVYSQMGGSSGFLGQATTAETTTPDNTGKFQSYQGGTIWQSPSSGVHETHGAIGSAYQGKNAQAGFLGYPLTSETTTPDGVGRYNNFQGGSIHWTPSTGAHEVHGAIGDNWANLGWERSFLGYPITDETPTPDGIGRYNNFQSGSIHWTPSTGPHEVHGWIGWEWSNLGWERGVLGYPVTDETATPDRIGRYNHFQSGSIYWTPSSGPHEVHGGIRDVWVSMGSERGALGYPVSDEYSSSPGFERSDFQHGSLTWNLATGQWYITWR
jgi:hypothetical protein